MRDDLMIEAIAWELDAKVSARSAHAYKSVGHKLAYFCPVEECLASVSLGEKSNIYFLAPDRHVPGCPNDSKRTGQASVPGRPAARPMQVVEEPIPSHLGPPAGFKKKLRLPSREELLQLARATSVTPVSHFGTLREVIKAWKKMRSSDRAKFPLTISGHQMNYESAFQFIGEADRNIERLNFQERIIFGQAYVEEWGHCFAVFSLYKFTVEGRKLSLRYTVNKKDNPEDLRSLVGRNVTIFLHGPVPYLSPKGDVLMLKTDPNDKYAGIIIVGQ
ncbi:hypothetical protein [Deefgea rivuli]|uniref:hypothetical protein n=1 Tax=Deefgea rivuli TaxID=400948 RepID=UPI000683F55D|nr:hypothetical protein [Deefgea rivuli]